MLRQWLGGAYEEFLRARRERQPYAHASIEAESSSLFDWVTLDEVLSAKPAPDVIVVERGQLLREPAPGRATEVRSLFARGVGIVVRQAQRHAPSLQRLSEQVQAELAGRVHVQLFVTPGGTHGFSWHYDAEDVVIVQTCGEKDFYFRENTQSPQLEEGALPDFGLIKSETSPLLSCRLVAGDALYLPRGTWHVARALHDALSLSIGIR